MTDTIPQAHSLAATPPPEAWRWRLAVFLGYLAAGVIFTWPLLLHWQTGVIQKGSIPVDAGQNVWNLWWVRQTLLDGANPYFTRYLFYPEQINLFWQTLSLPNALTVFPFLVWFGPVFAFNTLVLLSFGLGGYFAYRLGRAVLTDRVAALLVGFVYAFAPYHMQPLLGGALEIIAVQWIPLYVLMLMRALDRPNVWRTLSAAAALLLTTLASHYYGLFCAVYSVAHVGLALRLTPGTARRARRLASASGIALVWAGALLPFVWPIGALGTATLEDWYNRQVFHAAALSDFLMLNVRHPLWGDLATRWTSALHPFGVEIGASPGFVVYALVIYGCVRYWRLAWPWLSLALLTMLLALGPELKLAGEPTGIPLPFRLLDLFGPFQNSTRPSRFVAVMMLPVAVLAGYGAQALLARRAQQRPLLAGLIGGLLLAEFIVAPWPVLPLRVDPLYHLLNTYHQPGAVIELPPRNDDSQYMLNQFCHGRPLSGGYLARTPAYPLVHYDSTMRRLWYAEGAPPDIFQYDPAGELEKIGVRFVVLHLDQLSESATGRLRRLLAAPGIVPFSADERIEIYQVDAAAAHPVLLPTAGWYPPETSGGQTWRWIGDEAHMRLLARSRAVVSLSLVVTAFESPRPLQVLLNGRQVSSTLVPAAPQSQSFTMAFVVPPGVNEVTLRSQALQAPDGRDVSVSVTRLTFSSSDVPASPLPAALEPPPVLPALPWAPCQ